MWKKRRLLVSGSRPCEERKRDRDRERQAEKESVGNPLGEAWRNIVSGSYQLWILISEAIDGQASTCTHIQTHAPVSGVIAATVSLSVLSTVSRYQVKKQPLSTNVTGANGDIKAYWTKALDCSLHREPAATGGERGEKDRGAGKGENRWMW